MLICNPAVQNLIRSDKGAQIASAMQSGRGQGVTLLNDQLASLVQSGAVDPDEAMARAVEEDDLGRRLGRLAPA